MVPEQFRGRTKFDVRLDRMENRADGRKVKGMNGGQLERLADFCLHQAGINMGRAPSPTYFRTGGKRFQRA